jgi:aminoglycoside/choline kinase family phosphotransferase
MDIQAHIQQWNPDFQIRSATEITNLSASSRKFWRVTSDDFSVVVGYDPDLTEGRLRLLHRKTDFFNQNGVVVPKILFSDSGYKIIIWEDAGTESLLLQMQKEEWDFRQFKKFTIESILPVWKQLWQARPPGDWPHFGIVKYLFEWEFHGLHKVAGKIKLFDFQPSFLQEVLKIQIDYFEKLIETRIVPLHRDFQSSNIFMQNGNCILVDFQDALNGHPLYDVVSYIFDSYTPWRFEERLQFLDEIIEKYHLLIEPLRSKQELKKEGYFLIFQRKLHDMGAFAYAAERTEDHRFTGFLKPTVQMVHKAAQILSEPVLIAFTKAIQGEYND